MGLDQYAIAVDEDIEVNYDTSIFDVGEQVAYWRKHNRLQGFMETLWEKKGRPGLPDEAKDAPNAFGSHFNCIPLELTSEDIDTLDTIIDLHLLPETGGFFFGDDSYEDRDEDAEASEYYYKQDDLKFIENAKEEISNGKKIYYTCWW